MKKPISITRADLAKIITTIDPTLQTTDPGLIHASVLMASCLLGTDRRLLSEYTQVPLQVIVTIGARLEAGGIWNGNEVDCSEWLRRAACPFL